MTAWQCKNYWSLNSPQDDSLKESVFDPRVVIVPSRDRFAELSTDSVFLFGMPMYLLVSWDLWKFIISTQLSSEFQNVFRGRTSPWQTPSLWILPCDLFTAWILVRHCDSVRGSPPHAISSICCISLAPYRKKLCAMSIAPRNTIVAMPCAILKIW